MRERLAGYAETLRDFWLTYSIYIMIPLSIAAFLTGLYYMLHDVV